MADRKQHPSGRPIPTREVKRRPVWRIPDEGAVTPRLRQHQNNTQAIGFYVNSVRDDEDCG